MKYPVMEEKKEGADAGGSGELNLDAAVDSLAGDLGLGAEKPAGSATPSPTGDTGKPKAETQPGTTEPPKAREVPKSWPKELHEYWPKTDPKMQEYWETREKQWHEGIEGYKGDATYGKSLKEVFGPYQPLLDAQGIKDHSIAARYLLNAHYQLSQADPAKKAGFFAGLAKSYGIDLNDALKHVSEAAYADPALKELSEKFTKLETTLTAEQTARVEELRSKTAAEVEAFASDPKHAYFDEVADDIALLLQNPKMSLEQAYERAVWANPVTRAKEQARLQKESEDALRDKARKEAEAARKARGTQIRGEAEKPAADVVGSMEDTLRSTYKEIQDRT